MRRSELVLLALCALLAGGMLYMRRHVLEERLRRHNTEAAADSSRVVDSIAHVSERLAFQEREIQLRGDLARVLRAKNEQTQLLARVQISLDSLAGVVTSGDVSSGADSSIRQLAAELDSAGFHAEVRAWVPAPPQRATVIWNLRRDPVEVIAALNRTPDGAAALRVQTGANSSARIDTVRIAIGNQLRQTQRMAIPAAAILLGFVLGRLVR